MARKQDQSRAWREPEATSASGGHLTPGMDATGPLFDSLVDPLSTTPRGDGAAVRRRKVVDKASAAVGTDGATTERKTSRKPAKAAVGTDAPTTERKTRRKAPKGSVTNDAPTAERKTMRTPAARVAQTEPLIPADDRQTAPPQIRTPARKRRPTVRRVKRTLKRVGPFSVFKLSLFYYGCFLVLWLGFVAVVFWIVQSMGLFEAVEDFSKGFALDWGKIDISLWLVEKWALYIGLGLCLLGSLINAFLAFIYNVASDLVGGLELTFLERDN